MQAPDRVFLKRAAECERMAELTRDPESSLLGQMAYVRKCLQAAAHKRHRAPASPKNSGTNELRVCRSWPWNKGRRIAPAAPILLS